MRIKYSYMITQENRHLRMITGELTEQDIIDLIQSKYESRDLPCPIHFNHETTNIDITIDEVTI